jgi:hypothetical protein
MKSILLSHAEKYPMMEPTDAVKLLYQSEFGGGHLIQDVEACLSFLRREYVSTPQTADLPLTEDIGNGFVRVNLAALDHSSLSVELLGEIFLLSAAHPHGSMNSFRDKLALLAELTREGKMPFSMDALQTYLADYKIAGFPAASHSDVYRAAYRPAYRVVSKNHLPWQVL